MHKTREFTHAHTHIQWQQVLRAECSISKTILATYIVLCQISTDNRYKPRPAYNTVQLSPPGFTVKASHCKHLLWIQCMYQICCLWKTFKSRIWTSLQTGDRSTKPRWKPLGTFQFIRWIFQLSPAACRTELQRELNWRRALSLIATCCESFIIWVNWVPNFALSKS